MRILKRLSRSVILKRGQRPQTGRHSGEMWKPFQEAQASTYTEQRSMAGGRPLQRCLWTLGPTEDGWVLDRQEGSPEGRMGTASRNGH